MTRYQTKQAIEYPFGWYKRTTIPAGTPVTPAENLPDPLRYWVSSWAGITPEAEGWLETYGFLLDPDEIEEAPTHDLR